MSTHSAAPDRADPRAAVFSALLPGLGQLVQRRPQPGLIVCTITLLLIALAIGIGRVAGAGAEIFAMVLLVLPWWAFQAYDAYLADSPTPGTILRTAAIARARGHDIRYLGALFLISAVMDLYIILKQPQYALSVFCTKPEGPMGLLLKAQSPTIHTCIGYGFLRLRRWALLLYLAYAGFGLINAMANFACFGYGRVRTVFLVSLLAFSAYVVMRRQVFTR